MLYHATYPCDVFITYYIRIKPYQYFINFLVTTNLYIHPILKCVAIYNSLQSMPLDSFFFILKISPKPGTCVKISEILYTLNYNMCTVDSIHRSKTEYWTGKKSSRKSWKTQ